VELMSVERRPWSNKDINTIKEVYPHTKNSEIGDMLGRTEGAIRQKSCRLHLLKDLDYIPKVQRKSHLGKTRILITPTLKYTLENMYNQQRLSLREIAHTLGFHSHGTIRSYFKRLGIKARHGSEARSFRNSSNWKGGRMVNCDGYIAIYMPGHHRAHANHVLEHIYVWEQVHNRQLPQGWIVHHLNGIRNDNRPENLVAMPRGKHTKVELGEAYKRKIRELEAKVKLLERVLETNQMIFNIGEN